MTTLPSTGTIDHRYQIEAKLGQGASGIVYRVFDTKLKRRMALKLLRRDLGRWDGTQRFEREFHAIGKLKHPNILSVYELSNNYFTMEYVEGIPLNPQEKRDLHTIIRITIEICRALRYIHSQGIIHGDLKPAHILVNANASVRLIDFGLSEQFDPKRKLGDLKSTAAGTLEYMAPEQAKGMGVDPRADLYSLGVLLYELCTGRPPFTDTDPMALIMKQIEIPPRPPREYNPQITHQMESMILKLLSKEPSARYQSVDEILSVLYHLIGRPEVQESRIERGSRYLYLPRYIGRAREIQTLEGLFQKTVRGEGTVALIQGERGLGSSRLVNEFGSKHFFGGSIVLNAICEPKPSRPYAPFAQWVELGVALLEKKGAPELVARLAQSGAAGLKRICPALANDPHLKEIRAPLFADARRLGRDLAGLLQLLAEIDPVLVVLEDAHWVDRLSCQLLETLCQEIGAFRILLCVTADKPLKGETSEFHLTLPRLSKLAHFNDFSLQPLSNTEIVQLTASMLGRETMDPLLAPKITAAARGNPMVAQEMMKALAEQGILYKQGGRWLVDERSIEKVKPSEELEDWLIEKAQHLDKQHHTVLEAAVLTRHNITFNLIQNLTRVDPTTLYYVLTDLVRERFLSETRTESRQVYALASDRLQESVYAGIGEATRRAWHQRAAELLEGANQEAREPILDDIAYHYARGKTPAKALPYFLRCAERSAGLLAHAQAIEFFNAAIEVGEYAKQQEEFAGILLRIGEIYLEMDNRSEARRRLQEARERCKREERTPLLARAYLRLAEVCLRDRLLDEASAHLERCRAIYEQMSDQAGIVRQLLLSARVFETRFQRDQSLALAREAEKIAEPLNQPILSAEANLACGTTLAALGKFEEAFEPLRKAERLFASLEHAEGIFQSRLERARALSGLGQTEDAYPLAKQLAAEIENMRPLLRVHGYLLLGQIEGKALQLGSAQRFLDKALQIAEEADDPYLLASAQFAHAEAVLAQTQELTGRRRRDALRLLKQARDLFARGGFDGDRGRVHGVLEDAERQFIEGDISSLRRERDDLRLLQKVIAAVNSELDLERLLNLIMDMVIEVVKAERGFLILTDDRTASPAVGESPKLSIAVARNIDKEIVDRPEFKISNSISQIVIESRRPILTRDAQTDERFRSKISVLNLKLRSILCVPLLNKQKMIGAVYVDNRFVSDQFNEDNLRLLVAFADQAAIAIENARLYQDNVQRRRDLEDANRSINELNAQLQQKMVAQGRELEEVKEVLATSRKELAQQYSYHNILGRSDAIRQVFRQLERIKDTEAPVLIQGESGSGKELVSHLIHFNGPRKDKQIVSENCASISPSLLESELFGYVRGAFTGAVKNKKGLFESAHQGTLFLDEIGETSLEMQSRLLRVLENGELRPVGGEHTIQVDVRIITASNRDLKELVEAGKFREDLYYRLNVVRIDLPPLRARKEDIPLLLDHFLGESAQKNRLAAKKLSAGAMKLLLEHPWPGNVRELKNFAERALLLSPEETIRDEDVRAILRPTAKLPSHADLPPSYKEARRVVLENFDREFVTGALSRNDGNVSATAREIGIERQYLHKILKRMETGGADPEPAGAEPEPPESPAQTSP